MSKTLLFLACSALGLAAVSQPANAYQAGDWVARVGVGQVNPKSDNGTLAGTLDLEVDTDVKTYVLKQDYFEREY